MADPLTRDEALARGFKPVPDIGALAAGHGLSIDELNQRKHDFAARLGVHCTNQTVGQVCFDWTDDNGVRTICYCTTTQTCGDCVQK